jgi:hypothetical protein
MAGELGRTAQRGNRLLDELEPLDRVQPDDLVPDPLDRDRPEPRFGEFQPEFSAFCCNQKMDNSWGRPVRDVSGGSKNRLPKA